MVLSDQEHTCAEVVESVQLEGALPPPLPHGEVNQNKFHLIVVEKQGKRVSIHVKGTQGFWKNLMDRLRELFAKQPLQSQVIEAVEEAGKES